MYFSFKGCSGMSYVMDICKLEDITPDVSENAIKELKSDKPRMGRPPKVIDESKQNVRAS